MSEQKNILVVFPDAKRYTAQLEQAVEGGNYDCSFTYKLADEVQPADVVDTHAVLGTLLPPKLTQAKNLEWLQLSWAGADLFCKPGVLDESVVLTNASGAYGLSCSEHMLALTFALIRNIPEYVRKQDQRIWQQNANISSIEGSTILVLGLGDIGGDYARKVKALGAFVIGMRRSKANKPDYVDELITLDELDSVLPRADIVAGALPGNAAVAHLLNEQRLRAMKSGAFFVNVGRGNILDQDALKRVLADGHLGGVGLDVLEAEPLPQDDELWANERVLITPHVAGQLFLDETVARMVAIVTKNLHAWSQGEPLSHVVNRELGY